MFGIIPPSFYHTFFLILFGVLVFTHVLKLSQTSNGQLLHQSRADSGYYGALLLSIFLIIFFGTRNPNSEIFADTIGYAGRYNSIKNAGTSSVWYSIFTSQTSERIWAQLLLFTAKCNFNVSVWFTTIAAVYIYSIFISVRKIFPNHVLLACVFAFLNFGFYGGAINGIRNGMALSIVLLALTIIITKERRMLWAILLMGIAYEIHSSTILPSLCLLCSVYFIKKPKLTIAIWFSSIAISLVAGNAIAPIFDSLGLDDRLSSYLESGNTGLMNNAFSNIGFRWDFLIFSAVPIVWGWWIITKKHLNDKKYGIIFNTYVLANSFWVLVIRASFSNRFAALSWFLYFLVLIYPMLKHNLFPRQGATISIMLIGLFLVNIII